MSEVLGFLGALGSGLLNASSANDTNRIAQNQFRENMAFQKYQYDDMKRWNTYKNQVRLMKEAGINPALMFGSGQSGMPISSIGGVSPTAAQTTPDFSGLPSAAANLMSGISSVSLNKSVEDVNNSAVLKNTEDAIAKRIDNSYKNKDWQSLLRQRKVMTDLSDKELELADKTLGSKIEQEEWKAQYQRSIAAAQLISNNWIDKVKQSEVSQAIASANMLVAQGKAFSGL